MMNILKVLRIASEVNQLTDDEIKMFVDYVKEEKADFLEFLFSVKLKEKTSVKELA